MIDVDKMKEMGFNMIPLKSKSKEPIGGLNWKQFQDNKYIGSYPNSCNIGVVCGSSSGNIFVVDLDDVTLYDEYPEEIKNTFTVKTGKGYHIYYRYNGFPPPNKKLDDKKGRHIDIKSHGGYVLAPTSVHPNGSIYTAINDLPVADIGIGELKEHLKNMGFDVETKPIEEIAEGISEGGRNDSTFKYTCYLIRDKGLFGEALNFEIEKLNQKHSPPLPDDELERIIDQALKSEKRNLGRHIQDAQTVIEQLGNKPHKLTMQEITPSFENRPVEFDCMIVAVGERQTYTVSATFECVLCGSSREVFCDDLHRLAVPYCMNDNRKFTIDESTKVTAYIQQLRIQEFLETSRNASPVEFDAEIVDEDVGEAFIGDRKTVCAKFRSIAKKNEQYNTIVFQINKMKDLEQKEGCMPSLEEVEKWKAHPNIFERVTASIVPDIYINPKIVESLILWACGGNSLNGKRDLIHAGILGDAQLGKSELLLKMYKLLPGAGMTVGRNTSGAGLTIAMIKLYNGTMIPKAGFFPMHTGHPCIIDEIDKMKKEDHNSCLEVMEQQTTTLTKAGVSGLTLPTKCPLLIAGNPKNGKFNSKYASVMDNFDMETPFVSRFDILWMLVDQNDPETDKLIRKFIRSYQSRKEEYMSVEELQRYFEYIRSLDASIPEEFMDKIDELHEKMRPLNVASGVPIGWRQYHGLYRLLTASAKAHLRMEVNNDDFEIVESIIRESYKTMKMDLEKGEASDPMINRKDRVNVMLLEVWGECMDKELDNTVDKQEFISKLNKKSGRLDSEIKFNKMLESGILEYDNDLERYKKVK